MRRLFQLALSVGVLFSAAVVAQPQPPTAGNMRLFDRYSITVPSTWRAGKAMRNAETLYVPLPKPRGTREPRVRWRGHSVTRR